MSDIATVMIETANKVRGINGPRHGHVRLALIAKANGLDQKSLVAAAHKLAPMLELQIIRHGRLGWIATDAA